MENEMFYLDNIIKQTDSNDKNIVRIIRARGFFIEEKNGKYFVSDNASIGDVGYLKELFERHKIGSIIDPDKYDTRRRVQRRPNDLPYVYDYQVIIPETIEVYINEKATIESAIELFLDMGQNSSQAGPCRYKWLPFTVETLTGKISASYLEAYVAFYVKAVSACGVQTCYSCDGNHKNGGRIYVHSDYPWELWHSCIWRYIVQAKYGDVPYIGSGIVFDDTNQKEVYRLVYDIATYLYDNRAEIRKLKNLTVENINKKYRKTHSEQEIEQFYFEECERVFNNTKIP